MLTIAAEDFGLVNVSGQEEAKRGSTAVAASFVIHFVPAKILMIRRSRGEDKRKLSNLRI